ncbi:MAG TPA: UDP-3-O-(3-hydroxymyristoyl)glucosamine N-acyltransferase [Caulobacterales bacterium]|jgi:UDP-3-O-[3-hydroxymyristoyl] glucosamine N-acyltransferase|nr:UDP-3-O-(3-hydroxymyristoyl)glucosamine N-acyltransferase [Caulobacterales bacterium]
MIDPRFYADHGPLSLAALFPDCEIKGDSGALVRGLGALDSAGPDDLSFFEGKAKEKLATKAGAIVIRRAEAEAAPAGANLVLVTHPRAQFSRAAPSLFSPRPFQNGAAIAPDARLEGGVTIGPGAVIGPGAAVGQGAEIGPNAVIGPGVTIGRRTRIGAGAVIGFALIGDDVNILAGAVIGQAGFGVAPGPGGLVDVAHFGRVIIEDRVTLGAGSTVDRGQFADTIISEDAKIDNLCHIAHNVVIGRGVLIAAYGGISGSTTIGDGAILAGRVGVVDHVTVGPGATLTAGSSVLTSVPARERWGGYPAKALRQWLREVNWLAKAAGRRGDAGSGD